MYLSVHDNAGNTIDYHFFNGNVPNKIQSLRFAVQNQCTNTTKPTIYSIALDDPAVETPGTVRITADLSDNLSGIGYAHISFAKWIADNMEYAGY